MDATTLVSVEQYLSSVYEPDCDYVDGELEDRNVGEKDHSKLQFRVQMPLSRIPGIANLSGSPYPRSAHSVQSAGCVRIPHRTSRTSFHHTAVSGGRDPLAGRWLVAPNPEAGGLFCDGLSEYLDSRSGPVQGLSLPGRRRL